MTQNGQGPEQGGAQAWGGAWGPAGGPPQPGGQPLPPAQPLPPEAPAAGDLQATQYIAPVPAQPQGAPMPPAGPPAGYGYPPPVAAYGTDPDAQATRHMAPVPGGVPPQGPPAGYGYPPPAAAPVADLQATQHIAPVTGGVPPQGGAGGAQTQFLGTGRLPQPPAGASDATQYMAPVPGSGGPVPGGPMPGGPVPGGPGAGGAGPSQPPAEFDSLFRDAAPAQPAPPAYQQPAPAPYQQRPPHPHQPPPQQQYGYPGGGGHQAPGGPQDGYYDDEPAPRRKSPVALIAAVVVGCAVVGLGVGALLSGGDEEKAPTAGTSAAPSSAPSAAGGDTSPAPVEKEDPAEPQAKELDKLLATSNDSRDAVISSVEAIKQCKNLDKAAADLRGAAQQRRGLVTKLQTLSIDKLPDSGALKASLTRAWQASASADDHYAGWAAQMKAKNACKGGQAKQTNHSKAANAKSGEATEAKQEAAGLWNPIAGKYGLTKRSATQL
ncbi:hypothetical protein ACFZCF_10545 [Streptomyces sp. NPDC007945]|uniref:hypothetical protein n=1 Tax=Streptomyces sp. NPDC007945 TaxID=3364797 RepID=UPI0036E8A2EC